MSGPENTQRLSSTASYQSHSKSSLEKTRGPPSANILTEPITPQTLPSYRRLITLLLPIRYPDKFFHESIADTTESSLARVAIWQNPSKCKNNATTESSGSLSQSEPSDGIVVAGIQCRVEDNTSKPAGECQLYIQTIGVLAPYRQLGIATCLLEDIIDIVIEFYENVTSIYAHVWEANADALLWYIQRGFSVEDEVIGGYYRRLKPSGGKIVRRKLTVADHLAAKERYATVPPG